MTKLSWILALTDLLWLWAGKAFKYLSNNPVLLSSQCYPRSDIASPSISDDLQRPPVHIKHYVVEIQLLSLSHWGSSIIKYIFFPFWDLQIAQRKSNLFQKSWVCAEFNTEVSTSSIENILRGMKFFLHNVLLCPWRDIKHAVKKCLHSIRHIRWSVLFIDPLYIL